ncbi:class I SAM-dependent methyltransferase [Usitatibacter palustris]|uniref:Methyltransferase type 12 domain-containing protein n=1 Tax=Usitatibacter palustris TaxID=2732487 RepID=A0A6M4H650_9PROT|nr:class I SAM-dependent methyltransferase [Usitatibacter palustris]QJR14133.1 hypothetical protein DSM104440_00926 [Usitatibacter palustris]
MSDAKMIVHDPTGLTPDVDAKYPPWKYVARLPSVSFLDSIGAPNLENFYVVGEAWASVLGRFMPAGSTVIDIGCGCGRTARFLLLRPDIRYIGFDVFKPAIEWADRYLSPLTDGRFRFEHFDAYSAHYNPRGAMQAAEVRFPAPDASADVAFAASLFTHLLEPDANHYLKESARVLRPGGVLVASVHIEPKPGEKFSGREDRIDVEPAYFQAMAERAGLRLRERLGDVCGQETFAFERR